MQGVKLFSVVVALFLTTAGYAKGHGGGHGGGGNHSGGHGGGHSASRSSGGHNTGARSGTKTTNNAARHTTHARGINTIGGTNRNIRTMQVPGYRGNGLPVVTSHEYYGTGYNPYYGYGYNPYFYNPYFSIWSLGMGFMYSPNYGYYPPVNNSYGSNSYDNNNGGVVDETLEGYVVYARDTLQGEVTLGHKAIFLEKTDSGHNYDYKFRMNQKQLACVNVTNDDNKQLNLVRLKDDHKHLYRVIHEGRLNIYDEKHDFIYRPDDVDIRSLVVVYNGRTIHLNGSSLAPDDIKERLAGLVNAAYEMKLDAAKFRWNELLIYIDKLD